MPMMVEVEVNYQFSEILRLVKLIKDHTGWGLKESKDWVDNLRDTKKSSLKVQNASLFEKEINLIKGVSTNNRAKIRLEKLIKIGIAGRDEKIDFYSEKMSIDFISYSVDNSGKINFDKTNQYIKNLLSKLDDENLKKVVN